MHKGKKVLSLGSGGEGEDDRLIPLGEKSYRLLFLRLRLAAVASLNLEIPKQAPF